MRHLSSLFSILISTSLVFIFWYQLGRPVNLKPEIAPDHKLQSVSYTPLIGSESPRNLEQGLVVPRERLESDFALLARRFNGIRTYATRGIEHLPATAARHGLKVMLGAWVNGNPQKTKEELERLTALARANPGVIQALVVGNETLLRGELTGGQLVAYLRQVKAAVPEIPVTYADVWAFWLKNPIVAEAVDFVTIHILPYWEDDAPSSATAMDEVKAIYSKIRTAFPGKSIAIGEIGWPSAGRMRQRALPSPVDQARFLRGFIAHAEQAQWSYNLIEAFDQPWKRTDEGIVGGYWGVFAADRADKGVFSGEVSNFPHWLWLFAASLALLLIALTLVTGARALKQRLVIGAWMVFGALLLVLAAERTAMTARNLGEWAVMIAVLISAGWVWVMGIYSLARGAVPPATYRAWRASWLDSTREVIHGRVRLGLTAYVLILAVGLVFEGRSRDLEHYALFLPAFWYAGAAIKKPAPGGILERLSGAVLSASAVFVLVNETPFNWQSDLWVLISALWGGTLVWEGRRVTLRPLYPYFALITGTWIAVSGVRYGLIESDALMNFCVGSNHGICVLRSVLGLLNHFHAFGWVSVVLSVVAAYKQTPVTLSAGFILAVVSLVLYQGHLGAIALVITGLSLAAAQDRSPRLCSVGYHP